MKRLVVSIVSIMGTATLSFLAGTWYGESSSTRSYVAASSNTQGVTVVTPDQQSPEAQHTGEPVRGDSNERKPEKPAQDILEGQRVQPPDNGGLAGWSAGALQVLRAGFPGSTIDSVGGNWLRINRPDGSKIFLPQIDTSLGAGTRLLMILCSPSLPPLLGVTDGIDSIGSQVEVDLWFDGTKLADIEHERWTVMNGGIPLLAPENPKQWIYRIARSKTFYVLSKGVWNVTYSTDGLRYSELAKPCGLPAISQE